AAAARGGGDPRAGRTLRCHPGGRPRAPGARDTRPRLFAAPGNAGKPLWPPVPHFQGESRAVWDPWFCSPPLFVDGGRGLITYGGKRGLTWRAVQTGAEVRTLDSPELAERIGAIELSPDGRYLAVHGVQLPPCIRLF